MASRRHRRVEWDRTERNFAGEPDYAFLRVNDGATVQVTFGSVGRALGYLAWTPHGTFELVGLPESAVLFREGLDVAHAPLKTAADQQAYRRSGLVGALLRGDDLAP